MVIITKSKIEWCDYTWNPAWGCENKCPYCYARKISKRFGAKFGIKDFKPTWIESNFQKSFPQKPSRIFVNSMSDIFYWEQSWMDRILMKIKNNREHQYFFLTKHPGLYKHQLFPRNCWLGTTVSDESSLSNTKKLNNLFTNNKKFISFEPIISKVFSSAICDIDWLILGLETGRKKPTYMPHREFIKDIVMMAEELKVLVFMKDSMRQVWKGKLIQELPQ